MKICKFVDIKVMESVERTREFEGMRNVSLSIHRDKMNGVDDRANMLQSHHGRAVSFEVMLNYPHVDVRGVAMELIPVNKDARKISTGMRKGEKYIKA